MSSFRLYGEDFDGFNTGGASPGAAATPYPDMPPQMLPRDLSLYQIPSLPGSLPSTSPVSLTFSGDTNPLPTNQVSLASTPLSATFDIPPYPFDPASGLESYPPPEYNDAGKQYHFKKWSLKDLKGVKDKNMRACLNCYVKSTSCKSEPDGRQCRACEKKGGYCKGDIEMPPLIKKGFLQDQISLISYDSSEPQTVACLERHAQILPTSIGDRDPSRIQITCHLHQAEAPFEAQVLHMIDRVGRMFKTAPRSLFKTQLRSDSLHDFQVVSRRACACLALFGNLGHCILDFQDGQARSMIQVALKFLCQLVLQTHRAFEDTFTQIRLWVSAKRPDRSDAKKMIAVTAFHLGEMHRELALVHSRSCPSHPVRNIMSNLNQTLAKLVFYGRGFNSEEFSKGQQKDMISLPLVHLHTSTDWKKQPHSVVSLLAILDAYGPLCASKNRSLSLKPRPILHQAANADPLSLHSTSLQSNTVGTGAWDHGGIRGARLSRWHASPTSSTTNIASLQEQNADIVERVTKLLQIKSTNDDRIQELQNEELDHRNAMSDSTAFAGDYHVDDLGLSMGEVDMEDVTYWPSSSWVQHQASPIDMGRGTQLIPAQSLQQGLTTMEEQRISSLGAQNPATPGHRKRRRMQEQFQVSPTPEEDLFDCRSVDHARPTSTEVVPIHPNVNDTARTDQHLTQDKATSATDGQASRASPRGSSVEMRSPPPSPGGESESGSEDGETAPSGKARRPMTWPTRAVRRSWTMSVKALVKVFEELNPI